MHSTTLADVATAAGVPLGNVYYYFKTKDDLIRAVLDAYDDDYRKVHELLDAQPAPPDRLKAFVGLLAGAAERITRYGCPIGSLCSELDKRNDALTDRGASVLGRLIDIATAEFAGMGRADARYEGAALLANTLRDPAILTGEANRLQRWIDSLA